MAVLMLFASLWSVIQLAVLGSWSRSLRISTLALALAMGMYGCGILTVLLELLWTRGLSAVTGASISSVVDTAAYTVDPIIEEVVKVLPLILVGWFVRRVSRQLGLTDHLLVGAATGAGFALFETLLRYGTVRSLATEIKGGYLVQASLGGVVYVPGLPTSLLTWLPEPAAVMDILGDGGGGANQHVAWSALAALGVGWFWRRTGRWRYLGAVPLVYASADHMHENLVASSPRLSGIGEGASSVMSWLHGGLGFLVVIALVAAVMLDRVALHGARSAHPEVLLPSERPSGLALLPLPTVARLAAPWTTVIVSRFVLARRAALYAAAADPDDSQLLDHVVRVRDQITRAGKREAWTRAVPGLGLGPVSIRPLLRNWRFVVWLVLLVPPLLYFVVGAFPQTRAIQQGLGSDVGTKVLIGFAVAGLGWLGWQLVAHLRGARAVLALPTGETVGRLLIRVFAGLGSLVAGIVLVATALTGAAGSRVVSNYHALDALGSLLFAAGLLLFLWGLFMFPPFALAALPMGGSILVSTIAGELILTAAGGAFLGSLGLLLNEASGEGSGESSSGESGSSGGKSRFDERLDQAGEKLPDEWGKGNPNKKKPGQRWQDPDNPGNGVRIDEGDPSSPFPSQRVDHVIVRVDGKVIGRDGEPIRGSIKDDAENAHIPLDEWLAWKGWGSP